jgi:ABC-2 type transport system permease protein
MAEILRQPALIFSLIVGPFLVLFAFGQGVSIGGPQPRTIIVRETEPAPDAAELLPSAEQLETYIDVIGETRDLNLAVEWLRRGEADAVMVMPADPIGHLERAEQIPLRVIAGSIDPVRLSYARAFLRDQVSVLNQQTIERAITEAQESGYVRQVEGAALGAIDLSRVPPKVVSAPFNLILEEGLTFTPNFTQFYAPAVLALLIQHLGVTLGAFTMTRMRILRLTDLLRVAPVRATEVVTGHYLSYGLLTLLVGGTLLAAMHWLLDVPVLGSWAVLVGTMVLLALTSLGIGLVISLVSASEQQAVQLAMLVLLASIFFSGFAFAIDLIGWPSRGVSYALPATYAIETFQDVMLRGVFREARNLYVLGAAAAGLFLVTVGLMKREFRPG